MRETIFKVISRFVMLFCLALFFGCTASTYVSVNKINAKPKHADSIEYFGGQPKRSGLLLGNITVNGGASADHEHILNAAKKKAAQLGGDYIIKVEAGTETESRITKHNDVITSHYPWGIFSVWVYTPSKLGVRIDKANIVYGFFNGSDAELSGMKIGDQIIRIDGIDLKDENLSQYLMGIQPGEKITYSVLRNGIKIDFVITALPNV